MNTNKLFLAGCILVAPFLFSYDDGVAEHQNKDRTGAPGSDANCGASCHDDNQFDTQLIIELLDPMTDNPVSEYLSGVTYEIKYTIETGMGSPSVFGFQSTVLLGNNSNAGMFSMPGMDVQIEDVNGRHILEHHIDSPSNVFTADWTAPQEGSGPVTFYASGIAANNNNGNSGDGYDGAVLEIEEGSVSVFENEMHSVAIAASGSQLTLTHLPIGLITVYSMSGQIITRQRSTSDQMQIDVAGESGIYVVVVTSGSRNQSKKILIL
jgi:hypothetical protein